MLEALKIDHFTLEDKFMLLEELWESMNKDITANDFTPQWHINILESRKQKLEKNELSFSDISTVKERLKKIKDRDFFSISCLKSKDLTP